MLYGTLLPAPMIGQKLADVMRSVAAAGHDIGVHSWDHVRWHDRLDRMTPEQIEHDYRSAHEVFDSIFGFKARASGAAGWHATAASLAAQEKYGLLYTSDTRGGSPCFLEANGQKFQTLEIPSTLPTWDEMLGDPALADDTAFINYFRALIKDTEVHSIHTEVEGTAKAALFERQVNGWIADGVDFLTLADLAAEQLKNTAAVPRRRLIRTTIANRGGEVSSTQ
jgi:peptidoglycan/xylan/chitin deacetylase (PgdA/CDA1 family)